MDGKLEGDVRDPEKRRPLLATEELFEDHHLRSLRESAPAGAPQLPPYLVPQTGAQLCRLPHYRLLHPVTDDDLTSEEGRRAEAEAWRALYAEDYRANIAVGQMHEHKDTCFKYVVDKGLRFAKHCRFHFCHFVKLWLRRTDEEKQKPPREVTIARTGKDLVLPYDPVTRARQDPCALGGDGEPVPVRPTRELGPTVVTEQGHLKEGLVLPIRYNPLEGSSNGPAQVSLRGNVDFQSMRRTFKHGFTSMRDVLREGFLTEAEQAAADAEADAAFDAELPQRVKAARAQRRQRGLAAKDDEELAEELRVARAARRAADRRLSPVQRFVKVMSTWCCSWAMKSAWRPHLCWRA